MDTNGHEKIRTTNGLNHENHERPEKIQNHEWTRMDTNIEVNHERP